MYLLGKHRVVAESCLQQTWKIQDRRKEFIYAAQDLAGPLHMGRSPGREQVRFHSPLWQGTSDDQLAKQLGQGSPAEEDGISGPQHLKGSRLAKAGRGTWRGELSLGEHSPAEHFSGPWLVWNLDYHLEVQPQAEHLVRATVVYSQILSSPLGQFVCRAELLSGGSTTPQVSITLAAPSHAYKRDAVTASAKESWVEMDLSSHVQARASQKSLVLRVSHACAFLGQPGGSLAPGSGGEDTVSLSDPFLLLFLNDTRRGLRGRLGLPASEYFPLHEMPPRSHVHLRRARQAGRLALDLPSYRRADSIKQTECALHPFRVSFSQLGWDHWIIAPHWYRPQYCKGNCPRVLHGAYNSPNHAIVQNFINELVNQSVPRPSCVPYAYSPISVLMMEQNGNILYKVYEDMIAKSCTCR
ncbi:bone morphogenetic protein 15 isoform X1 [Rhineura floridana]|uniref:bone morphogenetic protein 15 isoform X1 n=1 Tax=Rhineura floridana TaxID=261503 RepID=UPI002AC7FB4B|nr:bone morphogenetic protein 15 isoform X1 [Rhineura floridana]